MPRHTAASLYARDLASSTPVDAATEREWARAGQRDRLVSANLRYGVMLARRFGKGLEFEDAIQQANLGLVRASELFDPDAGVRFTTYATNWVRHFILRFKESDQRKTVRIPSHLHPIIRAIWKGQVSTVEEIVARFGKSEETALDVLSIVAARGSVSLDFVPPEGRGLEVAAPVASPEELTEQAETADHIRRAMSYLTDRERDVIERHVLGDETLEQIGEGYGLSRERIRQVQEMALKRLRRLLDPERPPPRGRRTQTFALPPPIAAVEHEETAAEEVSMASDEQKAEAVARLLKRDESVATIAKDYNVGPSALYYWRDQLARKTKADGQPDRDLAPPSKADRVEELLGDARPERRRSRDVAAAQSPAARERRAPDRRPARAALRRDEPSADVVDVIEGLGVSYAVGRIIEALVVGDLDRASIALERARNRRAA